MTATLTRTPTFDIGDRVVCDTGATRRCGTVRDVDDTNDWQWLVVQLDRDTRSTYERASEWRPLRDGDGVL